MRLVENLNINNTFRALNLNTYTEPLEEKVIRVTESNTRRIKRVLKENDGEGYTFIIDADSSQPNIINAVYGSKGRINMMVNSMLPIPMLFAMGSNRRAQVIYKYHEGYSHDELVNMATVAEVVKTCVVVAADGESLPDVTKLLFNVNDLRYIIDRIYFNLEDTNTNKKLKLFKNSHEVLARWKIQLYIKCESEEERQALLKDGVLIGS
jgi:hypothetical protein